MAGAKRGLGRGLGALFGEDTVEKVVADEKAEDRNVANGAARIVEKRNKKANKTKQSQKTGGNTAKKSGNSTNRNKASKTKILQQKAEKTTAEPIASAETEETKNKKDFHAVSEIKLESMAEPEIKSETKSIAETEEKTELEMNISEIEPNQNQPRKAFNQAQLEELADSIRKYGVLQPLLVQKKDDTYTIIAGERRWRAAKLAGLKTVPAVVREYSVQQAMEIALIENLQREDLNPIEEALAYQRLIEEFSLKQEEIAERVSKNRTTVTNSLRLLNLVPEIQQMLVEGRITSGHARALLAVADPKQQLELAEKVEAEHMSVREVEKAVKLLGKEKKEKKKDPVDEAVELVFQDMENRMKTVMGTKVNISRKDKTKGKIEIEYYSEAELERLVELIESIQQA